MYMCRIFFLHFSISERLGCFHVLAVIHSAAVNIGVHVFWGIMGSSGYMLRSGIARSYGSSIFNFSKSLHIVLHKGYTSLYS